MRETKATATRRALPLTLTLIIKILPHSEAPKMWRSLDGRAR